MARSIASIYRSLFPPTPRGCRPCRKSDRLLLELLEDRVLPAAVSWAVDASGSFDDPNNWSPARVPGANDDVVIDRAVNVTVTIGSGANIHSLQSKAKTTLLVAGGSLTVGASSEIDGPFKLSSGSLTANGPISLQGNSEWDIATVIATAEIVNNAVVTVPGGAEVTLGGTVTNNGKIELEPTTANVTLLDTGTLTFAGTGQLQADAGGKIQGGSGSYYSLFELAGGQMVTNAVGHTIHATGGGTLAFTWAAFQGAGTFLNQGLMTADDSGDIGFDFGVAATNSGTWKATAGGAIGVGHYTAVDNTAGQVMVDGGVLGNDGSIRGGSMSFTNVGTLGGSPQTDSSIPIGSVSGSTISFTGGSGIQGTEALNGVTIATGSDLLVHSSAYLTLGGTVTNNGTMELEPTTGNVALLDSGTLTLAGTGQLQADAGGKISGGSGSYYSYFGLASGQTLTNAASHTVRAAAGGVLSFTYIPFSGSGTVVNQGAMVADAGGSIGFITSVVVNSGTWKAVTNGTIGVGRSTAVDNTAGQVVVDGGALGNDGSIRGGSLSFTNGGTLNGSFPTDSSYPIGRLTGCAVAFTGGSGIQGTEALSSVTIASGSDVLVQASANLTLGGTVTNNGTIELEPTTGYVALLGSGTLAGTGQLLADSGGPIPGGSGSYYSYFELASGQTLTNAAGHTVRAAAGGVLSFTYVPFAGAGTLVNQGLMAADANGNIAVNTIAVVNRGTWTAAAGGRIGVGTSATLDSPGTVDADGGNITIAGPVSQVSGNALTGGTWIAAGGGTLGITSASTITASSAAITVAGTGSAFTNLSSASFTNSGSLTLGAGVHLKLTGDFAQTASGSLSFEVGGSPASGLFGQLTASGQAMLDGTLNVGLNSAYAPHKGDRYQLMSFAGRVGNFAKISGLRAGRDSLWEAVVGDTDVALNSLIDAAELAVQSITVPPTGTAGRSVPITYTVQNLQDNATAVARWVDSVYLSASATFDPSAELIGHVQHKGVVQGHSSYTETSTAPLPGVLPGDYHVFVIADSEGLVPDVDRSDSMLLASGVIHVDVPALTLGTPSSGIIDNGQDAFYRIDLAPGNSVQITVASAAAGVAELYAGYQSIPGPDAFAQFGFDPTKQQQQVVISPGQAGTYYLHLHGREGATGGQAFTITAQQTGFRILGIDRTSGGNTGSVTITIRGADLSPATTSSLVGADGTRHPAQVIYKDTTTVYATFDLTNAPLGAYDVRLDDQNLTATDPGAFTVVPGVAGEVVYNMSAPAYLRGGMLGTVTVTYENIGNTDAPAPLLEITATNAVMRLADQPDFGGPTAQFLAISPTGPAGIIPPGVPLHVTLYFQAANLTQGQATFTLGQSDLGAAIDWSESKAGLQPPGVPSDAWDAVWGNFLVAVGSTAGQLQSALDQDATYLSQLGEYTGDPDRLISFELQKADDFGAITQRYTAGAFGRGWPDPTNIKLTTDAAGNATILYSGQVRLFLIQSNGGFQGVPGDTATLTKQTDGSYQLREADGTITAFNADGTLAYTADTNGNKITAGYTNGLLTSLVDSTGDTVSFARNSQGRITQVTDPVGRVTTYTYDQTGQELLSVTDLAGTTSYEYTQDLTGPTAFAVRKIAYPDGSDTNFTYDSQGRLLSQYADDGNRKDQTITYGYPGPGETRVTDADGGTSTYFVNEFEQVAAYVDPLGHYFQFTFDANHNLTGEIGPNGIATTFTNNAAGDTTAATDPLGQQLKATFSSSFNQLTGLTDAKHHSTQYGYDPKSNLLSIAYPDSSREQFTYDPTGNLTESVDRMGNAIGYKYDPHNLLLEEDFADGSKITYTYDAHRNLLTATNAAGTTAFQYDAADRLLKVTQPNGMYLAFTYNAAGQRTQTVDQTGFTVNYQYDAAGRLAGLTDGKGNRIVLYTYDAAGRLACKDMGNGTYTLYAYDAAGNLTSIHNYAPDNSLVSMYDYKYDDQGRPISVTTKSGTTIYGYDATGQLIQVTLPDHRTISYQYDAAGNRIAVNDNGIITKYTTNDLNEYTQVGATQNTYDGDGNLISSTDSTGTTSLRYNLLHQLISVISSQGTWTYQYDALGNRIAVTQNGQQTQYLIDPTGIGNVVGEFDVGGNVTAHYTQGLGLTGRVDASGAAAYYNFDLTGNTTELTGAAGAVLNRYSYLPFGETQSATGTTPNPFVFAGQFGVTQDGNNLFFMRARFYTPATGQFISCDPSGLSGGDVNLRRYGLNNPLENADPSGQIGIPGLLLFWNLQTGPALPPASPTQRAIVEFVEKGRELVKGYTDAKDIAAKAHEKFIEAQNAEAAGGTEVVSGGAEGAAGTAEVTAGTAELEGAGAIGAPEVLLLGGEFVLVYRGTRYVSSKTGLDNAFTNAFLKYIFHNGQTNSAFTPEQCALLKGKLIKLPVKFEDL